MTTKVTLEFDSEAQAHRVANWLLDFDNHSVMESEAISLGAQVKSQLNPEAGK